MKKLPFRIITTSWDDGHQADLRLSQLLHESKIPGTFYMSPRNREIEPALRLSDAQILEVGTHHEIGAHTLTHPVLTKIPLSEVRDEIAGSKTYLEHLTGKPVEMFCYPRGAYNADIKQVVEELGFEGARTIAPYHTQTPKDYFQLHTTNHAWPVHANFAFRLAVVNNPRFIPMVTSRDWVKVALRTLEEVRVNGGIWHLWGHSWELEQANLWEGLATVLKTAAAQEGFQFMTNGELVRFLKDHRG